MCHLKLALSFCTLLFALGPKAADEAKTSSLHPAALSHLLLHFTANHIVVDLRMQELTLREVPRWSLDSDLSGHISTAELEANWDRVASMVEETLWLNLDGKVVHPEFGIQSYSHSSEPNADGSVDFTHVLLRAIVPRPQHLQQVGIHSDLFVDDGNPRHTLHITIQGLGTVDHLYLLRGDNRDYRVHLPSSSEILGQYLGLGWGHVLEGYDHLAFLLALLFGVAHWRALLGAITAFTLAHSITLGLAALGFLRLSPALVEPGIALSVLAVLVLHLRRPPQASHPWLPAFAFGLLHGFGFAGVLGEIGIPPGDRSISLLGFNLGVEAGQITFVLPIVFLAWLWQRKLDNNRCQQLRFAMALPTFAFAMWLFGRAAITYFFANQDHLLAGFALPLIGIVCALLLSFLPGGLPADRHQQQKLAGQAAVLLLCFQVGQLLA